MFCRKLLVTNNPVLGAAVSPCEFVEGDTLSVLLRVRDLVHRGWVLLSHPLYGNLRPNQHPYRSILAELPCGGSRPHVDLQSLEYIENALGIYLAEKDRILSDRDLPGGVKDDFAFIDAELMKESLSRYRMMPGDGFNKVAERR